MAQIIPIRDLKNTSAISELCNATREPIFVTKNGYGDMVLMNMEVYNQTMARLFVYDKLKEAEDELKNGVQGKPANKFMVNLRAQYEKL